MNNAPASLHDTVLQLAEALKQRGWMLATAESCTGGMIAAACTDVAGSSEWFDRGFVTYSNAAKTEMLGVPADVISQHGAVSEEVAQAMAFGAVKHSHAQVSIAVTGIAGPSGGSIDKPVGTVWFGWAIGDQVQTACIRWQGNRQTVRQHTLLHALQHLCQLIAPTTTPCTEK